MKLAIVVLNWNGADLLEKCLVSLSAQTHRDFQIVVVDNNSEDNSRQVLQKLKTKLGKKLHVIFNSKNSGFAGGVNIGITYALDNKFDGVALFNNDAVADKNWLKNLALSLTKNKNIGIVTGLLLHADGKTIDSSGDWYSKWGLPFPRSRGQKTKDAPKSGFVFGASGGASLYKAELFKDIGLFDEAFFAYYEDVDISFRAQLAGWKVFYTNNAIAFHERGASSDKIHGFAVYQTFKNLPLLYVKNVPATYFGVIGPRFFLAYWLLFFNTFTKGLGWPALKGWLVSLFYLAHAAKQRQHIQKQRQAPYEYIDSILWPDLPPEQSGLRKFRQMFKK